MGYSELLRFCSCKQGSCHSRMYENIFSAELVLILLHNSLIKSGKCVCSFTHPKVELKEGDYQNN